MDAIDWQRTPPREYMTLVAHDWILSRWWVLLIPGGLFWAATVQASARLFMTASVVLCLIAPMVLLAIYLGYALTPEAIAATRPHITLQHPDGSLELQFQPDPETGREYRPLLVPASLIASRTEQARRTIVRLNTQFRYIIIPKT